MTTSEPMRPEEPVTRSFMLVIYAGDRTGKGRRDFQEGMLGVKAPHAREIFNFGKRKAKFGKLPCYAQSP